MPGMACSSPTMAMGMRALLNELDHAVENVFAVGIEAEDEAAHHLDAVAAGWSPRCPAGCAGCSAACWLAIRLDSSGVSMPRNTETKPASFISCSSSGSSARLSEASVMKRKGCPCRLLPLDHRRQQIFARAPCCR